MRTQKRFRPTWTLLVLGVLSGCEACPGQQLQDTRAKPTLTPSTLDFGEVSVSQRTRNSFTIKNDGDRAFTDLTFTFTPDTDPAFKMGDLPASIPSLGQSRSIEVTVLPPVATTYAGKILIHGRVAEEGANDPRFMDLEVILTATAINNGLPDIEVSPLSVDFGRVGQDDVARQQITIRNIGIRDLILTEIRLDADPASPFHCATCVSTAATLTPTGSMSVEVVFAPTSVQEFTATLHVLSYDPDEPDVAIPLSGGGQEAPTACIEFLDDLSGLRPSGTVRMDGACSMVAVPGTYIASYEWELSYRTPGSTTVLESVIPSGQGPRGQTLTVTCPDPATTGATPCSTRVDTVADIAGRFQVSLTVTDSLGIRSAPITVEFRAIPEEALHIQLVWDHSTADLDLHFMRGEIFNHASDCYFSNRFPWWWGNDATDPRNPRLDVDDQSGFGPENTNVIAPEPGTYQIAVHYWNDKTDGDPSTLATVRVYVKGQLMLEQSQFFPHDQELWTVGDIEWPVDPDALPIINPIATVEPKIRPF